MQVQSLKKKSNKRTWVGSSIKLLMLIHNVTSRCTIWEKLTNKLSQTKNIVCMFEIAPLMQPAEKLLPHTYCIHNRSVQVHALFPTYTHKRSLVLFCLWWIWKPSVISWLYGMCLKLYFTTVFDKRACRSLSWWMIFGWIGKHIIILS